MKRFFSIIICIILLTSCKQKITQKDILKMNGYWEIEKVILTDGEEKKYKINETIDYFQIKDNQGFRKKVKPQLDGKYTVNDQKEEIKIIEKEEHFFIYYITPYGKWTEEILEITDAQLVLKNQQNLEYHYKKPIPFSLK